MFAATPRPARFSILTLDLPGAPPTNAGVLLEDVSSDRLYIRLRRDWDQIAPADADVLQAVETDLAGKSAELGAARLMEFLEDTLSNTLRVGDRQEVMVEDFSRTLGQLYRQLVRSNVLEFRTHLPRYTLAVAAGKFLENQEVEAEGWEETPADLRLTPEMFVAHIVGRSMEPRIPDRSLCVFRAGVTGSREGRLLLVEHQGGGANDRYTVKRYHSEKTQHPDGSWAHGRIRLEALNPEFESWDLAPQEDRFRIVAEFVRVLD